jgi:hypothetical protein
MWRTTLGALIGMLVGIGLTVLILRVAFAVIARITAPDVYEIEYSVIYQTLTLGAGFGAVCGALAGFASAILREWRKSRGWSGQG